MARSSMDFPAPLGPVKATISPAPTVKSMGPRERRLRFCTLSMEKP